MTKSECLSLLLAGASLAVFCLALAAATADGAMPDPDVAADHVDLIEVNHVFDLEGKPVLIQAVFYDWRPQEGEYAVRAWRLLKCNDQRPRRDFRTGGWELIFSDGETLRRVRGGGVQRNLDAVRRGASRARSVASGESHRPAIRARAA